MDVAGRMPYLFQRFPELEGRIPWTPILDSPPTPVSRLENIGRELGAGDFWIKRDDKTALPYGGNKPRKLEFVIADALKKGAAAIMTFGGIGTNHGLATTIYSKREGLDCNLVLTPQPVTDVVKRNLLLNCRLGANLRLGRNYGEVAAKALAWLGEETLAGRKVYVLPMGGSSVTGTLGYVNAGLEIAAQVKAGETPEPDYVFTPGGTSGTAAGLLAGFAIAGLRSKVVCVRVADPLFTNKWVVMGLANGALELLRRNGAKLPGRAVRRRDFILMEDYFGGAYGKPTPKGDKAILRLKETEGLKLEPTYTGKTMAAALDFIAERPSTEKFLYVMTYNSNDLSAELEGFGPENLPEEFRKYFSGGDEE